SFTDISPAKQARSLSRIAELSSPMGPLPPLVYVTKEQIRQMFKEGHYFERAESGEFRKSVAWERHVVSQSAPVPVCSLTQTLIYLDANGDEVAKVHQYLL